MNEAGLLAGCGLTGLALGSAYFAGLWWTVRRAVTSQRPAAWFAASFAVRALLAGAVFWLVARHGAAAVLTSLAGFVVARVVATRLVGRAHGRDAGIPPCT